MKRSVSVTIGGQRYTFKSDADEAYVHSLAGLVDEKMRDVQRSAKIATSHAIAVLAAMQIADELMRERERRATLRRRVREKSALLRAHLDREVSP